MSTETVKLEEVSFENERGDRLEGTVSGVVLGDYQRFGNRSLEVAATVGRRVIRSFFSVPSRRFSEWWTLAATGEIPGTIEEAVARADSVLVSRCVAIKDGRYWKVVRWEK
jgi:hypothetical protein